MDTGSPSPVRILDPVMPRRKPLLLGLILGLLASGWAAAARLDVTEEEAGKDLVLGRGDTLMVRLPANPSTGYDWSYSVTGEGMLRQEGDVIREVKGGSKGMVGSPITEVWNLKALRSGAFTITFSYARPWEKDVPPAKKVTWPVTIRP